MKGIVFIPHAQAQMVERNITKEEVRDAVQNPDAVQTQDSGRKKIIKKVERNQKSYVLVVVIEVADSSCNVITTFLTSKIEKYI